MKRKNSRISQITLNGFTTISVQTVIITSAPDQPVMDWNKYSAGSFFRSYHTLSRSHQHSLRSPHTASFSTISRQVYLESIVSRKSFQRCRRDHCFTFTHLRISSSSIHFNPRQPPREKPSSFNCTQPWRFDLPSWGWYEEQYRKNEDCDSDDVCWLSG